MARLHDQDGIREASHSPGQLQGFEQLLLAQPASIDVAEAERLIWYEDHFVTYCLA